MNQPTILALAAILILATGAAVAGDGVLEIHQACVATGCFPGDDPGFPVEIMNPGSYRLTSNLDLPDENTAGIYVEGSPVKLDLGGFAIVGTTACTFEPGPPFLINCAPLGIGQGIVSTSDTDVSVFNGFVRGTGSNGVYLSAGGDVSRLDVSETGGTGIYCNFGTVERSKVKLTELGGIRIERGRIDACTVEKIGENCMWVGGATVSDSTLRYCEGIGVRVDNAAVVTGNVVTEARGFGLDLTPGSGYGGNALNGNNLGNIYPQVNLGYEISTNVCGGDTTCP